MVQPYANEAIRGLGFQLGNLSLMLTLSELTKKPKRPIDTRCFGPRIENHLMQLAIAANERWQLSDGDRPVRLLEVELGG